MIQELCCLFSLSILDIPNTMVLPGDLASPVACYVLQGLSCKHLGFPHQSPALPRPRFHMYQRRMGLGQRANNFEKAESTNTNCS